ncbi:MAG: hypothetical protein ABR921_11585, partial [Candidatus Sulfotelmatobacter sp.]
MKKQLFPGGKNKIGAAVDTLEYLVLKFHRGWLPSARSRQPKHGRKPPWQRDSQVVYIPLKLPLGLGPPRTEESARIQIHRWYAVPLAEEQFLRQLDLVGAKSSRAAPGKERPSHCFSPVLCVFFY